MSSMRITVDTPPVDPLHGEKWRPVPGQERRFSVSNHGRLFDHVRGRLTGPAALREPLCSVIATTFGGPGRRGEVAVRIDTTQPLSARNVFWVLPEDLPRQDLPVSAPTGDALADKLAEIRVAAGLTQVVLGDAIGLRPERVADFERSRARPRGEVIRRWLHVCGADDQLDELLALVPGKVLVLA